MQGHTRVLIGRSQRLRQLSLAQIPIVLQVIRCILQFLLFIIVWTTAIASNLLISRSATLRLLIVAKLAAKNLTPALHAGPRLSLTRHATAALCHQIRYGTAKQLQWRCCI